MQISGKLPFTVIEADKKTYHRHKTGANQQLYFAIFDFKVLRRDIPARATFCSYVAFLLFLLSCIEEVMGPKICLGFTLIFAGGSNTSS